jgi:hypothetical protein
MQAKHQPHIMKDKVRSEILEQARTLLTQAHLLDDDRAFLKSVDEELGGKQLNEINTVLRRHYDINEDLGRKIHRMIVTDSKPILDLVYTHSYFMGYSGTRSTVQVSNDINTTNESQVYAELSYPCIEDVVDYLVTNKHITADSSILDIGSGSGRFVMCVQALFPEALALAHGVEIAQRRYDASKLLLERARHLVPIELFKNVQFFHDNIRDFSEPNGTSARR